MAAVAISACATTYPAGASAAGGNHKVRVVAAENFWGSIAAQLGGTKADVTSIITNPNTDPHDYEPTAADARIFATAQVAIVNGIGYDPWALKTLSAEGLNARTVLNVGTLLGVPDGGNPHRWYNPADVHAVIAAITADYQKADPNDAAYFRAQKDVFETKTLADYAAVIGGIKAKYAGTPIGASESIMGMLAPALGLKLLTPPTFLRAISEGTDPSAGDKSMIDQQIKSHAIKVYVYNSQNATPDVQAQVGEAKAAGIPVTTISETLTPAGATFEQWQTTQLQALRTALDTASGK